jgi:hypothetical protein
VLAVLELGVLVVLVLGVLVVLVLGVLVPELVVETGETCEAIGRHHSAGQHRQRRTLSTAPSAPHP